MCLWHSIFIWETEGKKKKIHILHECIYHIVMMNQNNSFHIILHNIVFQLAYLILWIFFDYQIFTDKYLIYLSFLIYLFLTWFTASIFVMIAFGSLEVNKSESSIT